MKIFSRLSLAIVSSLLFFNALAVTETKAQSPLNEILKRMGSHQKALHSLRSKARMERYNSQLQESDVIEGTAIYSRPADKQTFVRIDWTKPSDESLSFINGQYVVYRPRLRQAIAGKLDQTKENAGVIDAFSFVQMSRKEIKDKYNIKYLGQEKINGETETWHLVFTPKKPTVYKSAEFWVDANGMPNQVKVVELNNDWTIVLLSEFKKNDAIKASDFLITLPKGTKIITGDYTACSCFKPDNARDALEYWSDAVFSGKVTAVNGADYTFKTERVWKGAIDGEVIVRKYSAPNDCANNLTLGKRYVVFARKTAVVKGAPALDLLPCNMTSDITSVGGKKILKQIGKGKLLKKPTIRKTRASPKKNFSRRQNAGEHSQ